MLLRETVTRIVCTYRQELFLMQAKFLSFCHNRIFIKIETHAEFLKKTLTTIVDKLTNISPTVLAFALAGQPNYAKTVADGCPMKN